MLLAWGARFNAVERARIVDIAAHLDCDPSWLTACMAFETGRTFDPACRNKLSGAIGLIQFLASTARGLGTTLDALAAMSRLEQLEYVEHYLEPYAGRLRTLSDCYMAILWPKAIGKPEEYQIFIEGTSAYAQNAGLDTNRDHAVTKAEAAARVQALLDEGMRPENAADTETQPAAPIEEASRPYEPEITMPLTAGDAISNAAPVVGAFNPIAGLITGLAGTLIKAFSPLAQEKIAKEVNRHSGDPAVGNAVATAVVEAAQQLTGQNDPIQATIEAAKSPEIIAQVQQATLSKLSELTPFLDKIAQYEQQAFDRGEQSTNAAAARQAQSPQNAAIGLLLARSSVAMMAAVTILLAGALAVQVWLSDTHAPDATLMTLLAGAVGAILTNFGQLFNYLFGSTPASKAKDEAIAELAARRPRT